MEMCKLPELDPWDSSIKNFLDPTQGMDVKCNRRIEEVTKLVDGKLFITEKFINTTNCYYRCLFTKDDYTINFGAKQSFTNDPNCDIIEAVCSRKDQNTTFYRYLHTQIYVQKNDSKLKNDTNIPDSIEFAKNNFTKHLPDVHILIFDSTSLSSMYRTMPKTVDYIREKYVATPFKYLNKVGINSRPNGYAFLLGRLLRQPLEYCIDSVDNDTFIGFEFRDLGYKTLMSEDWALGVFNWPDCSGFKNGQPVDHYMRPFHLLIEGDKYNQQDLRNNIYDKSCKKPHMWQLDYLKKFIDKYKEQPKFSVSWMTRLTHNDINGLVPADKDYYEFFKEYMDKLRNSYIFLMGDHGLRVGSFRETKIGMIEDNNPALFVILPEKFRKNKMFMNIIQKNSNQLVSHFDLYASFVDIARDPVLSGPANRTSNKEIKLLGSSIFKPLPQPRSCSRFNISLTYCMCKYEYQPLNDTNLLKSISEHSVSWINKQIILNNASDKCAHLTLRNNSAKLEALEPDYRVGIFQITFEVTPSNGKFTGLIMKNMDTITKEISYEVISDRLPRLNLYDKQSKCVINNPNITAYCFCKE